MKGAYQWWFVLFWSLLAKNATVDDLVECFVDCACFLFGVNTGSNNYCFVF